MKSVRRRAVTAGVRERFATIEDDKRRQETAPKRNSVPRVAGFDRIDFPLRGQMANGTRPAGGSEPPEAPGERLESWKEIATYLRRDVRTVQRWERTDGLPIYRHKRAHRPIPYAYKSELDAWWTSRSDRGPVPESEGVPSEGYSVRRRLAAVIAAALIVGIAAGAYGVVRSRAARAATAAGRSSSASTSTDNSSAAADRGLQRSIAVLPFVDLSEGMKNEEFADGISEELIERLEKIDGLRVPSATSSFYFKNKQLPVADVARSLGVAYLLDGSVRKAGARVRVSARLIRAGDASVVWSESYDRPWRGILVVQDEIADEVVKAMTRWKARVN